MSRDALGAATAPRKVWSRLASQAPFFADDEALTPVNPRFIAFATRSLVKPFGGDELKVVRQRGARGIEAE
jgi:hypothetical protein